MLRLTASKDYALLRTVTTKVVGKYFVVVYLPTDSIMETIAGITVSRKVGGAVVRNKIKRRLRSFLSDYAVPCDFPFCVMCNIIALPSVVNADWQSFKMDLMACFIKIGKAIKGVTPPPPPYERGDNE